MQDVKIRLMAGGFQPKSISALLSCSGHYYSWPRAYQTADRHFVYNRRLLVDRIEEERKKPSRNASSWFTTGVANVALGNWAVAVQDLTKATAMEPQNREFRFYRGLIPMALRDLDQAAIDFNALSDISKDAARALERLPMSRGKRAADGLLSFMHNFETDIGWIPLDFRVGPEPLSKD